MDVYVYVCLSTHTYVRTYVRTYIHTYIHTYISKTEALNIFVFVYLCTYVVACLCIYVYIELYEDNTRKPCFKTSARLPENLSGLLLRSVT